MKALKIIGKIVAVLIIMGLVTWGSIEIGRNIAREPETEVILDDDITPVEGSDQGINEEIIEDYVFE